MFIEAYKGIKKYMKRGGTHFTVDCHSGTLMKSDLSSLGAFWPGVKILMGDTSEAIAELNKYLDILSKNCFMPEAVDMVEYKQVEGREG